MGLAGLGCSLQPNHWRPASWEPNCSRDPRKVRWVVDSPIERPSVPGPRFAGAVSYVKFRGLAQAPQPRGPATSTNLLGELEVSPRLMVSLVHHVHQVRRDEVDSTIPTSSRARSSPPPTTGLPSPSTSSQNQPARRTTSLRREPTSPLWPCWPWRSALPYLRMAPTTCSPCVGRRVDPQ